MNRTKAQLRAVLALSGWVALAATLLPAGAFLRWATILLFVTFGPGLALLHPQSGVRPPARLETLALAAPVSWSLATLTATALFLVQGFSTTVFLISLAAFCTVAALLPGLPLPAAMRQAGDEPSGAAGAGTGAGGEP
ncbi:hypothetical protein [Streptomyces fuscigenes]|uniref:hypothetical protein n=1 Tax=Streptomyces fuscigenes TaxID=1528880 RepID=UPI001F320287|nr:hypothetical protein [Streptomyces fuscigenes]MCF3960754.1 hypothetical protein [Streptomyces fuscigenes]